MKTLQKSFLIISILLTSQKCDAQKKSYNDFVKMGFEALASNNISLALNNYANALELNPDGLEGNYGLGVSLAIYCINNNGYCDSAIQTLQKVNTIQNSYRNTDYNIGMCYLSKGYFEDALLSFDKAIKYYPDNAKYRFYRGVTYLKLNNKPKACLELKQSYGMGYLDAKNVIQIHCK